MIYLTLKIALRYKDIRLPLLTWVGTKSLPIYLLHIIPLVLLKPFVDNGALGPYPHIFLYCTGVAMVMIIIHITQNTKFGKILPHQ